MEFHLTSITSTASNITNFYTLILEHLESHYLSNHRQVLESQSCPNQRHGSRSYSTATTSSFFTNIFNISDNIPSTIKSLTTGYFLGRRHCCCTGIKGSMSAIRCLCKYT